MNRALPLVIFALLGTAITYVYRKYGGQRRKQRVRRVPWKDIITGKAFLEIQQVTALEGSVYPSTRESYRALSSGLPRSTSPRTRHTHTENVDNSVESIHSLASITTNTTQSPHVVTTGMRRRQYQRNLQRQRSSLRSQSPSNSGNQTRDPLYDRLYTDSQLMSQPPGEQPYAMYPHENGFSPVGSQIISGGRDQDYYRYSEAPPEFGSDQYPAKNHPDHIGYHGPQGLSRGSLNFNTMKASFTEMGQSFSEAAQASIQRQKQIISDHLYGTSEQNYTLNHSSYHHLSQPQTGSGDEGDMFFNLLQIYASVEEKDAMVNASFSGFSEPDATGGYQLTPEEADALQQMFPMNSFPTHTHNVNQPTPSISHPSMGGSYNGGQNSRTFNHNLAVNHGRQVSLDTHSTHSSHSVRSTHSTRENALVGTTSTTNALPQIQTQNGAVLTTSSSANTATAPSGSTSRSRTPVFEKTPVLSSTSPATRPNAGINFDNGSNQVVQSHSAHMAQKQEQPQLLSHSNDSHLQTQARGQPKQQNYGIHHTASIGLQHSGLPLSKPATAHDRLLSLKARQSKEIRTDLAFPSSTQQRVNGGDYNTNGYSSYDKSRVEPRPQQHSAPAQNMYHPQQTQQQMLASQNPGQRSQLRRDGYDNRTNRGGFNSQAEFPVGTPSLNPFSTKSQGTLIIAPDASAFESEPRLSSRSNSGGRGHEREMDFIDQYAELDFSKAPFGFSPIMPTQASSR